MTETSAPAPAARRREPSFIELFTPKLVTALREGYHFSDFKADAIAGLTVAIVALPLAMAIGIASGTTPDRGLITSVIGGFLISAFGGSRVQIGGPTAAFIVVVYKIIEVHGFDGLVYATFMAGLILIAIGLLRLGSYIKYIPYPVIIGFTSGIAVSIFVSQLKDLFGLDATLPGDFLGKIKALIAAVQTAKPITMAVSALALGLVIGVKRFFPRAPNMLAAVVAGALVTAMLGLPVDTIATRFGGIPSSLPTPVLPSFDPAKIRDLLPEAMTIALLAGIESLLSAVIADGLTGRRHRSNCELVAQGIANCASALFGGISATGAIARTATNIRSGARTPIAGMLHAVYLLGFMLLAAPLLGYVPLAALAAVLVVVAWNICEVHAISRMLSKAPMSDRLVLIVTFALTVAVDLTVAIEAGIVLSAIIFMHRMAESVEIETGGHGYGNDIADSAARDHPVRDASARGYVVFRILGPFFFGAAVKVISALERTGMAPKLYILDFEAVPFIDTTAAAALGDFIGKAGAAKSRLIIAAARPEVRATMEAAGTPDAALEFMPTVDGAIAAAGTPG